VKQTTDMLGISKDISVIYNFVNEKEYHKRELSAVKSQYGIKPEEKVIIHISNFRKVKRVEDVIHTFAMITKHVQAKLLLVGDGPEYSESRQLVDKLHLHDQVLFLGKQKNVSDLLSISDLKLLLSEKESFGLVLLEAMSCEVPGIGTNVGGIPEVIKHNETGYIVELGDVEQAAAYAIHLLRDDALLRKFSQQALTQARTEFHSSKIVDEYLRLYDRVLAK
jgi:N-acetyl-alpha-D-glucosaminyl L-malate synthase BshA